MTNPWTDVRAGHEWIEAVNCKLWGWCSCGFGEFIVISKNQWQDHVASLPAQEPAVPAATPMDDSIPYDGPKGKLVRIARPEARSVASQVPAQPPTPLPDDDDQLDYSIRKKRAEAAPASPQIADGLEQEVMRVLAMTPILVVSTGQFNPRAIKHLADWLRTKLRAALAESEPCGHLRANVFGDDYGHPYCSVCEALKRARADALKEAVEIIEMSPTYRAHSDRSTLCHCATCAYVRGNVTEIRARAKKVQ